MRWRTRPLRRGSMTGLIALIAVLLSGPAAAGTAAAAQTSAGAVGAAAQARSGFDFRTSPPANDRLMGISCVTGSFCVAVGSYADPPGGTRSLAEAWNGSSWRILPGVFGAGLTDVSCPSTTFCMAIGGLAEIWNGHGWKAVQRPPGAAPTGVSCTRATFCMAVGRGKLCEAAAVWRGTVWRALPMPSPCGPADGRLAGVSCTSASRCLAVGTYMPDNEDQLTLAEAWNGTKWQLADAPSPGDHSADLLSGVSCPTRSFCLAVGGVVTETPLCPNDLTLCNLALTWNGHSWGQLTTPGASRTGLSRVSCANDHSCVAISGSTAMAWNGTGWTQPTMPQPGVTALSDFSCRPSLTCMAVGSYGTIDGAQLTLAEQWNGSSWRVRRTPSPGDAFSGLSGASCPSASNCMAVGTVIDDSDTQVTLAERWNGRRWRVLSAPSPGPHLNVLTAVSCPTISDCTAVGYYDAAGDQQAFAEQWDGASWHAQAVPHLGVLTGVSCVTTTSCVAVGSYLSSGQRLALTATWNGAAWTVQPSPVLGGSLTEFTDVACPSASDCIATGDYSTGVATTPLLPLTARWNGATWTVLTTPAPGGTDGLAAISCRGPSSCMAVGSTFFRRGRDLPRRTLAESWNGKGWKVRATPAVAGQLSPQLATVSCTVSAGTVSAGTVSARCMAVGGYLTTSGRAIAIAETWNGTRWSLLPIPSPSPQFNDLYAISCPAASRCVAVGETGVQRTLAYLWNGARWLLLRTRNP